MEILRKEKILIAAALLVCAVVYCLPVFFPLDAITSDDPVKDFDWLKVAAFENFARSSLAQGKLALWSPYFGGGYPLVAHPEDASLSPLTLPSYLFGEVVGMKIQLVLILFFGALGTYLFCRRILGFSLYGSLVSALGLMLAGWMAWRVHYGWPMHFGYYLFPWVVYFVARAAKDIRWFLAALFVMVVVLQQVAQGLPFFFMFLFFWAVSVDAGNWKTERRAPRTLITLALAVLTPLAGAFKTFGLLRLLSVNPRSVDYGTYSAADHFYTGLLEIASFAAFEADVFYKNIGLGIGVCLLAVVGALFLHKKVWHFLPGLFVFSWLALGPNAPLDLFKLFHRFPVFGAAHWPMKYTNFFMTFALCIFAGAGVEFISRRFGKGGKLAVTALAILAMMPLTIKHMGLMDRSFTKPMPAFTQGEFYQVAGADGVPRGGARHPNAVMYTLLLQNQGTIDWDGDLLLPENATPRQVIGPDGTREDVAGYRGEAYVLGNGHISQFQMDVNRFSAKGSADQDDYLIINQNFDSGWVGKPFPAVDVDGRLGMRVPQGAFEASFHYRPTWFYHGLIISLFTWLAGVLLWGKLTRRKKAGAS